MLSQIDKKDKMKVGIIRGGTSEEYSSSIKQGAEIIDYILTNLSESHTPVDIFIDTEGVWHMNGVPIKPLELGNKIDVLWNTAGLKAHNIISNISKPYISVPPFTEMLFKDREILNKHIKEIGIVMPRHIVLPLYQADIDGDRDQYAQKKAQMVLKKFPAPFIVRSFNKDMNGAIHLAKTFPQLVSAIDDISRHGNSVLIEEFILGKPISVHSVASFRGEDIYVFPSLQQKKEMSESKMKLTNLVKELHIHMGTPFYMKSNFVIHPKLGYFLYNIDFYPSFKEHSELFEVCDYVGVTPSELFAHIIDKS